VDGRRDFEQKIEGEQTCIWKAILWSVRFMSAKRITFDLDGVSRDAMCYVSVSQIWTL